MTVTPSEGSRQVADRFELEAEVHAGAMSRVFRARDLESGAMVAVKCPAQDSERELLRFRQESAILAELSHPGVVRFVAAEANRFESAYLATEWVAGETLRSRLGRGPLTLADSVSVARAAAEALGAAHRARIVHRDVKPANLMLIEAGAKTKLLDFGIARREAGGGLSAHVTFEGGTWAYMSPEQVLGAAELGPRVDIFALGCVLFECISGVAAFPAERAAATIAKVWQDPPLLSERTAGVPKPLLTLVQRLMAKDPSERPRDGAAAATELAALGELPASVAEPIAR
jgi:serine/threonine protein kinase